MAEYMRSPRDAISSWSSMIRESCASMRAMSCEGLGLRQQNVDPLDYNSLWQYKDFVSQRFWKIPTLSK